MIKKTLLLIWVWAIAPMSFAFSQAELMQTLQQPNNTQGNFSQQRFLKSLSKPISSSGQFVLVKNKGLLWTMQRPFPSQQRVTPTGIMQWNGSNWVSNEKLGQAQQIRLFLGLLAGDVSALQSQFDLVLSGTAQNWRLTLTPTSVLMKQIFNQIEICGDQVVKSIELQEKQGDRTLIHFSDVRLNQPLSDFAKTALE